MKSILYKSRANYLIEMKMKMRMKGTRMEMKTEDVVYFINDQNIRSRTRLSDYRHD